MSAEAKNLEAIQKAIVRHNGNCPGEIVEIQMCQYEVDRLGWDEFLGIPIRGTDTLPEGRFRLVCDRENPQDRLGEAMEDAEAGENVQAAN